MTQGTPARRPKQRFFVFIACDIGKTYAVGEEIVRRKKGIVRDVSSVSGDWDLLVLAELPGGADVGREIASLLEDIPNIRTTQTVAAYRIA